LIVERESEGFEVSRKLEKLGWHASDTGELSFCDVFVPENNLLGEENRGFYRLPLCGRFCGRFANETLTAIRAASATVKAETATYSPTSLTS
jgi:alkylation response protein AidB-like acyl-CoA dehydrogenase